MQIGVVDYGASNIFSVLRAVSHLGAKAKVISKQEDLKSIDKIILPGQGSMGACIENLKKKNLFESLKLSLSEKPYLGICLGLQILFALSEESSNSEGMNIFSGKVERFTENENFKFLIWVGIRLFLKKNTLLIKISRIQVIFILYILMLQKN